MEDRYPYIRFVIDAAQLIAGTLAALTLLGGTVSACSHGGLGGFVSFLITVALAGVVYVAVMVQIEVLRVLLDIESSARHSAAAPPQSAPPPTPSA
jgi:hypothetical protein